ncbi:hypothetical protein LS73_006620 [Helicobacter muridarum]|uniref:Uncharacterized protein n=1 Tax=Helicobacter muridarum TaxID=216 RepID=A0A099TXF6_9HELI|nr:hypothetical protein [Helicobacter muridarum]TLD99853.1 hypothetical protein LS73_006620 [Helicobacter muridarum]STQ86938.1 Uncharacterised protein [Helicobacter muridarum]
MIASLIMLHLYNKIPPESIPFIKDKLHKLDKLGLAKTILRMPLLRMYNVEIVFWVGGVLLGILGVGRFMVGDKLIGSLKITLIIISLLSIIASIIVNKFTEYEFSFVLVIIGYTMITIATIWWIIDIFLISARARRKNLNKLLMAFQIK